MILAMAGRMLCETDPRLLWKFAWNFGFKSMLAVHRFERRKARDGKVFPPFLYLSITNACQLACRGCWVSVTPPHPGPAGTHATPVQHLPRAAVDRIIQQAKRQGNRFFGILGGEPLLHPELMDILAGHPDCYFQVFTNGHLVTAEVARRWRRLGNVTPLISIEGNATVSDDRRGGGRALQVLDHSLSGLEQCVRARLITGVASSLCRNNLDDLLSEAWLRRLIRMRVQYCWYYGYRPVGPAPTPELALRPEDLLRARRFIVEMRSRMAIGIIDAYWDDAGRAICPMATGISHHINPWGEIEPCPILQFSKERATEGDLAAALTGSAFLADMRATAAAATRGCLLVERPELVAQVVARHGAADSAHRREGSGTAELMARVPGPSQHLPGQEIPERHWAYRLAKKHFFFGFGAYG